MVMKTFQIFRAGTHTTMAGKDITFTETDLAVMAATYSEAVRPANLVLGHPENDQPAHGTVKKLFLKGSKLYALADAGKALVDLVKAGRYGNVSAAFIPTKNGQWYLRHVGFLGAMPPAVKGMDPLNFSEAGKTGVYFEPLQVTFSEYSHGGVSLVAESGRLAFHHAALALVKATPGMSYADAVITVDKRTARHSERASSPEAPHPRAAFHEAAMCFMEAIPDATYSEAITQIQAAGMQL